MSVLEIMCGGASGRGCAKLPLGCVGICGSGLQFSGSWVGLCELGFPGSSLGLGGVAALGGCRGSRGSYHKPWGQMDLASSCLRGRVTGVRGGPFLPSLSMTSSTSPSELCLTTHTTPMWLSAVLPWDAARLCPGHVISGPSSSMGIAGCPGCLRSHLPAAGVGALLLGHPIITNNHIP